eukprot:4739975-Prymnesium_polylepis.1
MTNAASDDHNKLRALPRLPAKVAHRFGRPNSHTVHRAGSGRPRRPAALPPALRKREVTEPRLVASRRNTQSTVSMSSGRLRRSRLAALPTFLSLLTHGLRPR